MQKVRSYNLPLTEDKISLSPESGSLFHYYHSKVSAEKATNPVLSQSNSPLIPPMKINERYNARKHKRSRNRRRAPPQHNDNSDYFIHRMEKFPSLQVTDFINAEEEAEKHCSKTFCLKDSTNPSHGLWELPKFDDLFSHEEWQVPELMTMKDELNHMKSQLDSYDIDLWHKHTYNCNPALKVSHSVRARAKPELLTQAFLKFYEILHTFVIIPKTDDHPSLINKELKSLHLCEAPGAFIVALNHFLALHRPDLKWQWFGNTLNPHFEGTPASECIADDRFILHTQRNWFFGRDETGDLMSRQYLQELRQFLGTEGVSLVTADGSIDCQGNPSEQEDMTNALHFCEVVAAVATLRKGGSFILKKFTFFEAKSVSLMYLLCCCFDEVFVVKPMTSKSGNSEVYIVSIGYNSNVLKEKYIDNLSQYLGKVLPTSALFGLDQMPSSFVHQVINCCGVFKGYQIDAIQRNMTLYNINTEWNQQYCDLLKSNVMRKFNERNLSQPILPSKRVVPHHLDWDRLIIPENTILTKWGGQIGKRTKQGRLKFLRDQFRCLKMFYSRPISPTEESPVRQGTNLYRTKEVQQDEAVLSQVSVQEGKSFHFIFVSRFCHINLMQVFVHSIKENVTDTEWADVQAGHCPNFSFERNEDFKNVVNAKAEATTAEVSTTYPKALVLDEGYYIPPHSCIEAFKKFLVLLEQRKIVEGNDVVFLNCLLFTRLQNGLFSLISALFEKVIFHEPVKVSSANPFLVLVKFSPLEKADTLLNSLQREGWINSPTDKLNVKTFNQVLPLQNLIYSKLHSSICRYNALHTLSRIDSLQQIIELSE